MRYHEGDRLGKEREPVITGDRIEGEPPEPGAIGNDEFIPVKATGFVQQKYMRNRYITEPVPDETGNERLVRLKSRTKIIGFVQGDGFTGRPAPA